MHITPKALQFLELLLDRRPRALSKAEIHDGIWPKTFVSESSLARLVAETRKAIGDGSRDPRLIRTVYGYGYAFSGEVAAVAAGQTVRGGPAFRLAWGLQEIPLSEGGNVLGRIEDAAVRIDSRKVSRRHARIVVSGGRAILEDLRSKNGTYLRGRRIERPSELRDGDEICIGPVLLIFRTSGGAGSTETQEGR